VKAFGQSGDLRQRRQGQPRESYSQRHQEPAEAFRRANLDSCQTKGLFESLKLCSIQPLCQYHEAALLGSLSLVARYHGSLGTLRQGSLILLFGTLKHRATLIQKSRGRSW